MASSGPGGFRRAETTARPDRAPSPARARKRRPSGRAGDHDDDLHPMLGLQQQVGNQTISRLVQRGGAGEVMILAEQQRLKRVHELPNLSEDERIGMIKSKLGEMIIDSSDERWITDIWASFGARLPEVAGKHPDLFKKSIEEDADVADLPVFKAMRASFGADVVAATKGFLATNRKLIARERAKLGISDTGVEKSRYGELTQQAAVEEIQALAGQAQEIMAAEEGLKGIQVGMELGMYKEAMPKAVYFDPRREYHSAKWTETKEKWDEVQQLRMLVGNRSPGVFALMEHGAEKGPGEVAKTSPEDARAVIGGALDRVDTKIGETEHALDTDDLDWRELKQVHQQLYAGKARPGSTDWSRAVPQAVGKDVVQDYDDAEWWADIGLATLSAAAFVFSSLATGGLAAFAWAAVGTGISIGQAAASWESWDDLESAAQSGASYDTQVVSHEQASAAKTKAILDTVFAFIDAAGGVKAMARGASLFTKEAQLLKGAALTVSDVKRFIPKLDTLEPAAAKKTVEESVRELGALETIRQSGKSADELAELVGRESDIGKRLLGQAEAGVPKSWYEKFLAIVDDAKKRATLRQELGWVRDLPRDEAERLVVEAIDVLGPAETLRRAGGWQALVDTLGNGSTAGARLDQWRAAIEADLIAEFGAENVARTGRKGLFSNDFDVSTLGADAAANREKVKVFLAARAGVPPGELKRVLLVDVFTDPRRMHLATLGSLGLPTELRERIVKEQAARQEELIWNRRLYDVMEHGTDAEAMAIRDEMYELGIKEIPDFRPLSSGEVQRLGVQIDKLHGELLTAAGEKNHARVAELADEIADRQALVNASEGGGYFSGGGTRRYVSERDKVPGFGPGEAPAPLAAEAYLSFLDQATKLGEVAPELRRALAAAGTDEALERSLKALGKYGERLASDAGDVMHSVGRLDSEFDAMSWLFLAKDAKALKAEIEAGVLRSGLADEAAKVRDRGTALLDALEGRSRDARLRLLEASELGPVVSDYQVVHDAIRAELTAQRVMATARAALRELEELAKVMVSNKVGEGEPPGPVGPAPPDE